MLDIRQKSLFREKKIGKSLRMTVYEKKFTNTGLRKKVYERGFMKKVYEWRFMKKSLRMTVYEKKFEFFVYLYFLRNSVNE